MLLSVMQWTSHCVPWQTNCGCSCWALAPFLLVLVFCCLLRCFLWRNASLAGGFAGRRVCGFLWFLFCLFRTACCSNGHFLSLYKCLSDSLCSCKDRAFSATSAKLEEKKIQSSTVLTAMHCRFFRDDDILKCPEQFCGLHVARTYTNEKQRCRR